LSHSYYLVAFLPSNLRKHDWCLFVFGYDGWHGRIHYLCNRLLCCSLQKNWRTINDLWKVFYKKNVGMHKKSPIMRMELVLVNLPYFFSRTRMICWVIYFQIYYWQFLRTWYFKKLKFTYFTLVIMFFFMCKFVLLYVWVLSVYFEYPLKSSLSPF
jgi:hypothetical protein